jgi:hypothetical protein
VGQRADPDSGLKVAISSVAIGFFVLGNATRWMFVLSSDRAAAGRWYVTVPAKSAEAEFPDRRAGPISGSRIPNPESRIPDPDSCISIYLLPPVSCLPGV